MATSYTVGLDLCSEQLGKLGRPMIRQIVEAGAATAGSRQQSRIMNLHYKNGDMMASVQNGQYREDLDGGSIDVYPQGIDRRGVSNAMKAFVINYGRGGRHGPHSGDKFLTGDTGAEGVIQAAMQAESDRLIGSV